MEEQSSFSEYILTVKNLGILSLSLCCCPVLIIVLILLSPLCCLVLIVYKLCDLIRDFVVGNSHEQLSSDEEIGDFL